MDIVLENHELSYCQLFEKVGKGNYLHASLRAYTKAGVQTECTRQNKYAGCTEMDNKYTTSTSIRDGYITIYQRR